MVISVILQPMNALSPIVSRSSEKSNEGTDEQFSKALLPIDLTFERSTDLSDEQFANAPLPIEVTSPSKITV